MTHAPGRRNVRRPAAIPVVSLFSGCGAFDLGFTSAGFEVLYALDIDQSAVESYNHNRSESVAVQGDISKVVASDIIGALKEKRHGAKPRGVIGGSPCQSFSNSNVYSRADDARHRLPKDFARILSGLNAEFELDFFVFENVRGLTYQKHKETFTEFKKLFARAGFTLFEGLLDAADYGVAQHRPRVFVVGLNSKKLKGVKFKFPKATIRKHKTVKSVLHGLPKPKFYKRGLNSDNIPFHRNHWTMQPKSKRFQTGELKEGSISGRSFRVLSWNKPSWAVAYGNREIHIHPSGKRRLSVYEALRLQGLPKSYELIGTLSSQVSQVSDAVPPQLGKAIGKALKHALGQRGIGKA